MAATNHPGKIDPAVKRAGRLDREIAIEKPDTNSLARIFRHHLGRGILPDASTLPLALAARGMTGADAEAFVRRAKGAARRNGRSVTLDDLLAEIRQGRRPLTSAIRHRVAIHEAGHAIVARALRFGELVDLSLHDDGGQACLESTRDGGVTLTQLEAGLAALVAGRIAEEIELGDSSIGAGSGPSSDLAMATGIARDIELRFGFGIFGNIYLEAVGTETVMIAGLLPAIVERLRRASERARGILMEHRSALQTVGRLLEEAGYLTRGEIDQVLEKKMRTDAMLVVPAASGGEVS